jgi:hypothetical protein
MFGRKNEIMNILRGRMETFLYSTQSKESSEGKLKSPSDLAV